MLQDNGYLVLGTAVLDVLDNLTGLRRLARVAGGHVPVIILIAHVVHSLGEAGHDAGVEVADRVGTAAGETEKAGVLAGLSLDDLLHVEEILKEGIFAGIDGVVAVRGGVYADAVARAKSPTDLVIILGVLGRDKEGGLDVILVQHVKKPGSVRAGAVVKGEVDGLLRGCDLSRHGYRHHLHMAHGTHGLAEFTRDAVRDLIVPGNPGDYLALGDKVRAQVVAQLVTYRDAGVGIPQAGLHDGVGLAQKRDLRRLVAHVRKLALHRGHIAGAVADSVLHAVGKFQTLHLAGDIPIHIVAGGIALLGIAGHPGRGVALNVLELNDRGRGVRDGHMTLDTVFRKAVPRCVAQRIGTELSGVHTAAGFDRQMLLALAEEIARRHSV